jgi:hypothetical protein
MRRSVLKNAPAFRYPGVEARSEFLDTGRLVRTNLPSMSDSATALAGNAVFSAGLDPPKVSSFTGLSCHQKGHGLGKVVES